MCDIVLLMKDWTGNKRSIFATLAASSHSDTEREVNDFYATDPRAIDALVQKYKLPHKIWEPCCGAGHLAKQLELLGFDVVASDIVDRGYGEVADFFAHELPTGVDCILTNPPYKYADKAIERALELLPTGGVVAMFLKTQFLEGKNRYYKLFATTPPSRCYNSQGELSAPRMAILRQ